MVLTAREKAITMIANGITAYSMMQSNGTVPKDVSMIDFVLKAIPEEIKSEVTIELIDEVFVYVSRSHGT